MAVRSDWPQLRDILDKALHNIDETQRQAIADGQLDVRSYTTRVNAGDKLPAIAGGKFKPGDRLVVVEVADTGPGIKESKLETVFDPFFTTKPVGKGTGLGLSVSRSIVELHHGYIHFRNKPEGGAMASLYFKAV